MAQHCEKLQWIVVTCTPGQQHIAQRGCSILVGDIYESCRGHHKARVGSRMRPRGGMVVARYHVRKEKSAEALAECIEYKHTIFARNEHRGIRPEQRIKPHLALHRLSAECYFKARYIVALGRLLQVKRV